MCIGCFRVTYHRCLILRAILAIVSFGIFSPAFSSDELTFVESINDASNLANVSDPAVSPDGKHVYLVSFALSSVIVYERNNTTGQLTFVQRIEDATNIWAAFGVDVSPDGKHVYVSAPNNSSITVYSRDESTGELTFVEVNETDTLGLTTRGFVTVTASEDGRSVYGITGGDDGMVVFQRNADTGSLTFLEEHVDDFDGNLLGQEFTPSASPINNIAISDAGNFLYVTSTVDHAVSVYARNTATGALTLSSTVEDGVGGVDGIQGASSLVLSTDNKYLFVSGQGESSVAVFSVNSDTGALAYIEKKTDEVDGITTLGQARSLAISPDGRYLYVSAVSDNSITVFGINDATGALTLLMSLTDDVDSIDGLFGVSGMDADPSNRHLYGAGQGENSVSVFSLPIPAVTLSTSNVIATENGGPIVIDNAITLIDNDDTNLQSATVNLGSDFNPNDQLSVTTQAGVVASPQSDEGVITLTGDAPIEDYQDILRTITYEPGVDESIGDGETATREVNIQISDGTNLSAEVTVTVTVNGVPSNFAPTITGTPSTTVAEDSLYSFTPTGNDDDGDTLTYSISNKPDWASFHTSTGALTGTPTNDDVGTTSNIVISVSDGTESASLAAFNIEVTNTNDAPTISGTPSTTIAEDSVYSFTPTGGDIDVGDTLTYSISNKPAWASFDISTGALTGTPTNDNVGTTTNIVITISDGVASTNLTAFNIEVTNINDAPMISGAPMTTVAEDSAYNFTPTASDIDVGDTLTYSISNKPTWASFNTSTGALTGTPNNDDLGITNNIVISVSDGVASASLAPFSIEVTNTNDAPVISGNPSTTVAEGVSYSFIPTASDVDVGDTLTFSVANKPAWASFSTTSGALTGTPTNDDVGTVTNIIISVSDGEASASLSAFNIDVTNVNENPVAVDDSFSLSNNGNGSYVLDVLTNDMDEDGDTLQLVWVTTDNDSAIVQDTSVILQTDTTGTFDLKYGISDGNGGSDSASIIVLITSDDPQTVIITPPEDVEVDANALFTKVELGVAVAEDIDGNPLPVSLVDGLTFFAPGEHLAYWQAEDANGNEARVSQRVTVHPLVSIGKDDVTVEGKAHVVKVFLNGDAPSYPVTIPYIVSGSSDSSDHNLVSGSTTITSGTEGTIEFSITDDDIVEGVETLEITLDDSLNLGSKFRYTLSISEENIAPKVATTITQQGETRPLVEISSEVVTITATVTDANSLDTHSYNWINDNSQLVDISSNENQFIFSPENLTAGIYQLKLEVTDSASATVVTNIFVEVVEQLATLDTQDSDGDLIPDNQEGFTDGDNDGIPDYQDAISECNVIQEQALISETYLVEGEPGACLRKGVTLAGNETGGVQLLANELVDDTEASNIGGVFDFVAYGLPTVGQTYQIVFPQRLPIPANAVYRKYKESTGWEDFQSDANNSLASTEGEKGYCPPPGDSAWVTGLTEGHWCVQLTIEDGGPNDDDGLANGVIVDPGGVATVSQNSLPVALDDVVYIAIDSSQNIDVLANDSDADNDALTIVSASANFGSISIDNGIIAYQAATNFYGTDTINYSVTDGNGGSAFATVTVNVTPNAGGVINNTGGGGSSSGFAIVLLGMMGFIRRYGHKYAAIFLVLISFSSQANWFIDANLGVSKADSRLAVSDSEVISTDQSNTVWSFGVGYHINSDWAITGRYLDLGEGHATLSPDTSMDPTEYHAKVAKVTPALASGVAIDMAYALVNENRTSVQALLGVFWWEVDFESEYQGTYITSTDDGIDPYIGVRVDYNLNDRWTASWGMNHYFIDLNDVTSFMINIKYDL